MACGSITSWQIEGEKVEAVTDFTFLVSKITVDVTIAMKFKKCLLLGRKALTNLGSTLKSRDITLPIKVHPVKAVIMYECESWTKERAEHMRIVAFELWCWRTLGLQDQISES